MAEAPAETGDGVTGRQAHAGNIPKAKRRPKKKSKAAPRKHAPKCGADTRQCQCGHHKRDHAGREGRCFQCGTACEQFRARPCKQPAKINGRCIYHGGATPAGPLHPHWKSGRWSRHLPAWENKARGTDHRGNFLAALVDPTLMQLEHQAALIDAALVSLAAEVKPGKPLPVTLERRLLALSNELRQIKDTEARRQRDLRQLIPIESVKRFTFHVLTELRANIVLADGSPDMGRLQVIKGNLERALMGMEATAIGPTTKVIDEDPADE